MAFEQRFYARQTIVNLNHLADESVESGFEAGETVLHTGESRTERAELKHATNHGHDDREYGYTDREVQLDVRHPPFQL